jgi:hypothetical protein
VRTLLDHDHFHPIHVKFHHSSINPPLAPYPTEIETKSEGNGCEGRKKDNNK